MLASGYRGCVNDAHDTPSLDDVMEPTETARPDRREHAKAPPHPDDDELERRTEHEGAEVGLHDTEPTEEPPAT
jgi:hypothetical protein